MICLQVDLNLGVLLFGGITTPGFKSTLVENVEPCSILDPHPFKMELGKGDLHVWVPVNFLVAPSHPLSLLAFSRLVVVPRSETFSRGSDNGPRDVKVEVSFVFFWTCTRLSGSWSNGVTRIWAPPPWLTGPRQWPCRCAGEPSCRVASRPVPQPFRLLLGLVARFPCHPCTF